MELFFYNCEKEAPFKTLYYLDSSCKKLLISNHEQHITKFETYKERILDEAIGDTITDKKILVPKAVKAIFLEWVKEKYDDAKLEESGFDAEDFYLLGADELNNFIKGMNVEEELESVVKPLTTQPDTDKPQSLKLAGGIFIIIIITVIFYYINNKEKLTTITSFPGNNTPINGKNDNNGKLTITTSFPDSNIYINGKKQEQKTPVRELPVPAGNNIQIKIIPPDNDVKMCATIDLSPNESKNIGDNSVKNCTSQ